MVVNPGNFLAIIIDRRKQDHTNEIFKIASKKIEVTSQVKLLIIEIDNKLNFEQYINRISKSAANQLNALIRLGRFVGFQERKVLVNSFFYQTVISALLYGCLQVQNFIQKLKTYLKEH